MKERASVTAHEAVPVPPDDRRHASTCPIAAHDRGLIVFPKVAPLADHNILAGVDYALTDEDPIAAHKQEEFSGNYATKEQPHTNRCRVTLTKARRGKAQLRYRQSPSRFSARYCESEGCDRDASRAATLR